MTEPDPIAAVKLQLGEWLKEAMDMRRVESFPEHDAPAQMFYECLIEVRGRLDRVEELLGLAAGLRGSTARRAAELHDTAEDDWDRTAVAARRTPVTKEFEGARERYSDWNLQVLPQRLQERQMKRLADLAKETEDRVKVIYVGLGTVRQDCLKAIGYLQWESSLER